MQKNILFEQDGPYSRFFISHGQKDGWQYSTECQGADGHEGRPHTLLLCVLLWFGVTCCERQGLEVEVTRDDSSCDHCFFATKKWNHWLKNNNNNQGEDMILSARTHTEMVCARPGFCRAEQVVSQHPPYGLELQSGTQRWRDWKGGQRSEDSGRKPWKEGRMVEKEGKKNWVVKIKQGRMEAFQNVMNKDETRRKDHMMKV